MSTRELKNLNAMRIAEYLETLPPERFDMTNWCGTACCIAGHIIEKFGHEFKGDPGLVWLGLDNIARDNLFIWLRGSGLMMREVTPKMASRVLRHLAVTGKVDWDVLKE